MSLLHRTAAVLLFFAGALRAQTLPSSTPAELKVVFPGDRDTVDVVQVRYAGSVSDTSLRVTVNGTPTRVYPSGAFVGRIPLGQGENLILFEAYRGGEVVATDSVRVFRTPHAETLEDSPSRIVAAWPKGDVWVEPGALVEVQIRATPGGQATYTVPGLLKNGNMVELPAAESEWVNGIYRGVFSVPADARQRRARIRYRFKGADAKTHKVESRGQVLVLDPRVPLVAETADSTVLLRTAPRGAIVTELPKGIRLRVVGQRAGMFRIRLAPGREMYASMSTVRLLPVGTPPAQARVGSIAGEVIGDWVRLRVDLSDRVPYTIRQVNDRQAVEVTFFGAQQGREWITYPPADTTVRLISWRQDAEDITTLRVDLNGKQLWGFEGRYAGRQFWLQIRRPPDFAAAGDSLLKALIIAVDPGHGGTEPGAVGPTGLMEKDVNLKYATRVAELLRLEGATVVQTRTNDTTMTLEDRIRIAREAQAHLFVWLHNNSIGAGSDPVAVRGASTYFTVPQAREVAWDVYPRLLEIGLPPFGRIGSSYYVTRQTSMVTFLVEGAFLSNPLDEMLLMDEAFLDRLAGAVVKGIKDFVYGAAGGAELTERGEEAVTRTGGMTH